MPSKNTITSKVIGAVITFAFIYLTTNDKNLALTGSFIVCALKEEQP